MMVADQNDHMRSHGLARIHRWIQGFQELWAFV